MSMSATVAFSTPPKSLLVVTRRSAHQNSRFAKKQKQKTPGGIELTATRRPQQITMGSGTMGLTVPLKEPPYPPHLLVLFVVVWHVFAYQAPSQLATSVSWAAAWAPSVSGCQHTQPAQNKVPGGSLRNKRPDLLGRPHCKGMAIGVARRGARRSGERALRIPPSRLWSLWG